MAKKDSSASSVRKKRLERMIQMKNKKDKLFLLISGLICAILYIGLAVYKSADQFMTIVMTIIGIGVLVVCLCIVCIYYGLEQPTYEEARKTLLGSAYKDFEKL